MLFDVSKRQGARRGCAGAAARSASLLERCTAVVLRFRWVVLAGWLAVAFAGAVAWVALPGRLVTSLDVPGTESQRAEEAVARGFGERPEGSFTVVYRVRDSRDGQAQRQLRDRLQRAARVLPGGRVGLLRAGGGIVYGELETTLSLERARELTDEVRRLAGPDTLITGQPAIQHDLDPTLAGDLGRGEAIALPLTLLVLVAVLGASLAVSIPFVFAAATVGGTLVLLLGAARLVDVSSYATNVVELLGLGLAVDYSLLLLHRYREEVRKDGARDDAVARTMASTGRTVLVSGTAVAIGLTTMALVPVPFIRTLGLAGLLVPVVSMLAAVTLQPALLSLCGPRAFDGLVLPGRRARRREAWAALARAVMRRPVLVFAAATALLVAASAPALLLRLSPGSLASLPASTEAARGLAALTDAFGPGALTPTQIAVDGGSVGAARRPQVRAAIDRLVERLFHDPEVYVVATGRDETYVSRDGRYARVVAVGRHEYGAPASRRLVERVRTVHVPAARFPAPVRVLAGGAPPKGVDFLARAYSLFPWLVLLVLAATYVVLARAFGSLVLPLKAVLLNALSVTASCGLLVVVFQLGVGAGPLGLERTSAIEGWIPVFLFATLFGLSMDYEVFLVSRMREAWDVLDDNAAAVAFGLERTGRVITGAALVMSASFAGFVAGSVPGLQQFGLGLALAVVLDATLVRALLVPALMAILGRWNWWLPARPALRRRVRLEEALE